MRIEGFIFGLASLLVATPATAQGKALTLQPERLPGMCLSMTGFEGEAESRPCDGSAAQLFDVPGPEGGPIRHNGKCVVTKGRDYYQSLAAVACDGSVQQRWAMSKAGELRNPAGRCLSVLGASSRSGAPVFGTECPKDREGPAWRATEPGFVEPAEGLFESRARPGKCIGYDGALGVYDCKEVPDQLVSFDRKASGQLRMLVSCLSGGFAFDGLGLGECWDLPAQRWRMRENGQLANELEQCIEVKNQNGRDVLETKACRLTPEQQWVFRERPKQSGQ
jgi:hypothetical protein